MIYEVLLSAALCFATTSALPPCICTRDYTPVCGSDGQTYGNECLFNCAKSTKNGLTLSKMGSCNEEQKLCICTFEYKPVCGSDGTTYSNKCVLGCEPTVRLAHDGHCNEAMKESELPKCICTKQKKEVCGSDGNTYDNACLLNCATANNPRLSIVNSGACNNDVKVVEQPEDVKVAELPSCICTEEKKEVCGSDGNTYDNACLLNCATASNPSLSIASLEACKTEVKVVEQPEDEKVAELPSCICMEKKKEVCGSDGNTYDNACLLNCATANNPSLSIASLKACKTEVKVVEQPEDEKVAELPSCVCTEKKKEVCGSDGNTYDNACLLNCATANNPSLSIVNSGACNNDVKVVEQPEKVKVAELPSCICTKEKKEVCGSDGNTYDNPCFLNCATEFNPSLSIVSFEACKTEVKFVEQPAAGPVCACTRDMRPVCGSDGNTYGNPCMFKCAEKLNPSLTLARRGPCSTSPGHSPCACTRELRPVCASDGQTYASTCIMKCRNKEAEVVHDGDCVE